MLQDRKTFLVTVQDKKGNYLLFFKFRVPPFNSWPKDKKVGILE